MTHAPDSHHHVPDSPVYRRTSVPGNVLRGVMIGVVETVPGVSGGTVALVVGIYRQLIDSASAMVSAVRALITGPDRVNSMQVYLSLVQWRVVLPVMLGMGIGLFTAVQFIGGWVETYPELTRAAFFGMVVVSIAVPFRMALRSAGGRLSPRHWVLGATATAVAFVLVSLPPGMVEPHWWLVLPAAAVTVTALLLPGLSGSFLLLTFGLYEPTIAAARDLNVGYLSVFFAGAVLGLVSIVKGLKWLLDHHHTTTMVVLTGVMVGALRTLWPWQTEDRGLLAPDQLLGPAIGLAAAGAAVVAVLVILDFRLSRQMS